MKFVHLLLFAGLWLGLVAAPARGVPVDLLKVGDVTVSPQPAPVTTSVAAGGLTFNMTKGAELVALETSNPALATSVISGFQQAGNLWSSVISTPVTVNLTINYKALGTGILGSTSTISANYSVPSVINALSAQASSASGSASDVTAVASLDSTLIAGSLNMVTNDRAGARISDNDGSVNNDMLHVANANARALGLLAPSAAQDASITFSSAFTFDFDRGDGIAGGAFDFVGVAAHEIGHALGFQSGVDQVDYYSAPSGPGKTTDLNHGKGIGTLDATATFTVLDLFRHSADAGVTGVLDLAYGGTPYLSLDGGVTSFALFSTGDYNGDGQQASHWKDSQGIGIMDPTLAPGELAALSMQDQIAFDIIGYTLVPEPGSGSLMAMGAMLLGLCRRGRAARAAA